MSERDEASVIGFLVAGVELTWVMNEDSEEGTLCKCQGSSGVQTGFSMIELEGGEGIKDCGEQVEKSNCDHGKDETGSGLTT